LLIGDTAALLRILELSHEALLTGVVTTKRFESIFHFQIFSHFHLVSKFPFSHFHLSPERGYSSKVHYRILYQQVADAANRDIYYRDPELFTKQAVVDRYVDDLAYTLGVERDALNVASLLGPILETLCCSSF
jgi:hypothetical protein